jgi:hypothetical protein
VKLTLEEAVQAARELVSELRKVAEGAKRFDPRSEVVYLRRAAAIELLVAHAEAPAAEDVDLVDLAPRAGGSR